MLCFPILLPNTHKYIVSRDAVPVRWYCETYRGASQERCAISRDFLMQMTEVSNAHVSTCWLREITKGKVIQLFQPYECLLANVIGLVRHSRWGWCPSNYTSQHFWQKCIFISAQHRNGPPSAVNMATGEREYPAVDAQTECAMACDGSDSANCSLQKNSRTSVCRNDGRAQYFGFWACKRTVLRWRAGNRQWRYRWQASRFGGRG